MNDLLNLKTGAHLTYWSERRPHLRWQLFRKRGVRHHERRAGRGEVQHPRPAFQDAIDRVPQTSVAARTIDRYRFNQIVSVCDVQITNVRVVIAQAPLVACSLAEEVAKGSAHRGRRHAAQTTRAEALHEHFERHGTPIDRQPEFPRAEPFAVVRTVRCANVFVQGAEQDVRTANPGVRRRRVIPRRAEMGTARAAPSGPACPSACATP